MYITHDIARDLAEDFEWITPQNLCYLDKGRPDKKRYLIYKTELTRIYKQGQLKRLKNENGNTAYFRLDTKKKQLTTATFKHDNDLRNLICFLHFKTGHKFIHSVRFGKPYGNEDASHPFIRFENHRGGKGRDQIIRENLKHYEDRGKYIGVFFCGHKKQERPEQEQRNLDQLFEVIRSRFKANPNKILACTHTGLLTETKLYNHKGEDKTELFWEMFKKGLC